jgi:cytochrome c oxidase subunit IV
MLVWCAILFGLGILAFLDSIFNVGEIFRRVNSIMFMLISLGLLVRTTTKMKSKKIENYEKRVFSLEQQVKMLQEDHSKMAKF